MGHVKYGCVSVNDIARTHPLQATDDGSLHGQSAAEKRKRRRRVATTVSPTSAAGARRMCAAAAVIAATAAATWSIRRPLFA